MKYIAYIVVGFAAGIAVTMSCSDDSPPHADAATCDCPLSEPPISGRVTEVIVSVTLPPSTEGNGRSGQVAVCPMGSILVTGGCSAGEGQVPDIVIEQSSPVTRTPTSKGDAWSCSWRNNTGLPVAARVIARCLMASS